MQKIYKDKSTYNFVTGDAVVCEIAAVLRHRGVAAAVCDAICLYDATLAISD